MFSLGGRFVCKKGWGGMFGLQKRQRMFADPEIPVWMADPCNIEIILKSEWQIQIGSLS